jgi:DNA replication and repair protein RecF
MPLVSLELRNIRVYEHIELKPNPHLNLISGANASGKTTLLEAIHLLSTGRSFRTTKTEQLHRTGAPGLSVAGKLQMAGGEIIRLGLIHSEEGKRASINGLEQKQVSNLALQLPLQVISPDTHYEFQQYSKHRRGVLDWGLFHVEQDFPSLWTRFQRILLQRNTALKDGGQLKARHVWDEELVEIGEKLQHARARQTAQLLPYFQLCCQQFLGKNSSVDLILESGWEGDAGFGACLQQDRARDSARGFTHSGPQRADLRINLNEQASRTNASHGQFKMLVIALRLAQIMYLIESRNQNCCLLIDDLAAELDIEHRARLTRFLASLPIQLFITTTESSLIDREFWPSHDTFHVEHGTVTSQNLTRINSAESLEKC